VFGKEEPEILNGFRLSAGRIKTTWSESGTQEEGKQPSLVVLSFEHGAPVLAEVNTLITKNFNVDAVIVHGAAFSPDDIWTQFRLKENLRPGTSPPAWWQDCAVLASFTGGRLANVIKELANAAQTGSEQRFRNALDSLCQAARAARGCRTIPERYDRMEELLAKTFDKPAQPVFFVYHRLSGTVGGVLTALQHWEEDPDAESVQRLIGTGRKTWNEIRALIVGGDPCEWQRQTRAMALADLLPSKRDELSEHLRELERLRIFLGHLDEDPSHARQVLLTDKTADFLRAWFRKLQTILESFLES
jgi:hypothetical protein